MKPQDKIEIDEKLRELRDLATDFSDTLEDLGYYFSYNLKSSEGSLITDFLINNPISQFLDELDMEIEKMDYNDKKREVQNKVSSYHSGSQGAYFKRNL